MVRPDRLPPIQIRTLPARFVVDTYPRISPFVKLKLTSYARAGNRAGFFHARGFQLPRPNGVCGWTAA
jgi:hypothetical protein